MLFAGEVDGGGVGEVAIPHDEGAVLRGCRKHRHFSLQPCAQRVTSLLQIKVGLKVDPEPFRCSEVTGQPQRRIGGDAPQSMNDFIDAPRGDTDAQRQPILRHTERLKKVLQQNFSWMNGFEFSRGMTGPELAIIIAWWSNGTT